MAFDKTPTTWIASWSEDATNITVPLASFPEMTAAEADAATGDIRKILYAVCEALANTWYATAAANRPTYMTISRSTSTDETANTETKRYSFSFTTEVAVGGREVVAEA